MNHHIQKNNKSQHHSQFSFQHGFTLIEILIVIGIFGILVAMSVIGIMNIQVMTTNNTSTSVIVSDLKAQQVKAMTGDTEGRGTPDNYGVKILPDRYVLFNGMNYSAQNPANFSVPITTGFTLSTTFPDATILFASGSGSIVDFVDGQNTIQFTNTTSGQSKLIRINRYGTITSIE